MSLEGFVRASGAVMGVARESFGAGGTPGSPGVLGSGPGGRVAGSEGLAADGFHTESGVLDGHVVALGDQDGVSQQQLDGALAAAQGGRDRMDAVIDQAVADVGGLGPATNTPAGRRALVEALTRRLHDTKRALQDGHDDAATRAADADVSAAGYQGLGRFSPPPGTGAAMPAGMPMMGQMPSMMPSMGAMPMGAGMLPLAPLASLVNGFGRPSGFGGRAGAGSDPNGLLTGAAGDASSSAAIPAGDVGFEKLRFPGGREAYRHYIAQALDVMGITDPQARANWARGLDVGIGRESGFSPDAVNLSDSNAHGPRMADGAPANSSRGGMQTIPATFAANHQPGTSMDIYHPVANICAGMNYLMRHYHVSRDGSNLAAVHQFNPHSAPQGY